jgi:hypothetical protein
MLTPSRFRALSTGAFFLCASLPPFAKAANLISNSSFEEDTVGWSLFVPPDSYSKGCTMNVNTKPGLAHLGEGVLTLNAPSIARVAVVTQASVEVTPGERYRLTAWIKAADDFKPQAGTPGFYGRATLLTAKGKDVSGGHYYFDLAGRTTRNYSGDLPDGYVPTTWTKLEVSFEIPPETERMQPNFFISNGSGTLYIDDVSLELIDNQTDTSAISAKAAITPPIPKPKNISAATTPLSSTLPNPDFEIGLEGWHDAAPHTMCRLSTTAAHTGLQGLNIDDQSPQRGSDFSSTRLAAIPGQTYRTSFWGRVNVGSGVGVYLRFFDANGRVLNDEVRQNEIRLNLPTEDTQWTQYTFTGVAPHNAVAVEIWIHSYNAATVNADFDDFTLSSSAQ